MQKIKLGIYLFKKIENQDMFFYLSLKHLKVGIKSLMTFLRGFWCSAINKLDLIFKFKMWPKILIFLCRCTMGKLLIGQMVVQ